MSESNNENFRSLIFGAEGTGAYVQVFQRPGEKPLLEFCFFDGNDRTLEEAQARQNMTAQALTQAYQWDLDTNPEFSGKYCLECRAALMKKDLGAPVCPYCGIT